MNFDDDAFQRDCAYRAARYSESPAPRSVPASGRTTPHHVSAVSTNGSTIDRFSCGKPLTFQKCSFTSYDDTWATRGLPYTTATLPPGVLYVCGQPELCDTIDPRTGQRRKHFQGFAVFDSAVRPNQVWQKLGMSMSCNAWGNGNNRIDAAIAYTKKPVDPHQPSQWREAGSIPPNQYKPGERTENLMRVMIEARDAGTKPPDLFELAREDPGQVLRSWNALQSIQGKADRGPQERDIQVYYIQGRPGIGKTHLVLAMLERGNDVYIKEHPLLGNADNWDKYEGEDAVLIDEFPDDKYPIESMLRICDKWKLRLRCRYADRMAHYTRLYITANKPFEQLYPNLRRVKPGEEEDNDQWGAFCRRIPPQNRVVYHTQPPRDKVFASFAEFRDWQLRERHRQLALDRAAPRRTQRDEPRHLQMVPPLFFNNNNSDDDDQFTG